MPSRVQAQLSKADGEGPDGQQDHRGYLLQRLAQPMAAFYGDPDFDAAGVPYGLMLAPDAVMERLAARTTAELEGRLAEFYDRLLLVREAIMSGGQRLGPGVVGLFNKELCEGRFDGHLPGFVLWARGAGAGNHCSGSAPSAGLRVAPSNSHPDAVDVESCGPVAGGKDRPHAAARRARGGSAARAPAAGGCAPAFPAWS